MSSPDYSEVQICFLLEITWDSIVYRFASFPVDILDGNETKSYIGGLEDPEFEQQSNIQGLNLDSESIAFQLVFNGVDFVQERMMRGRMLDNSPGELSYITIREGSPVQTYDERILLFKGVVSQPLIGDPSQPVGYVAFSLVQGKDIEDKPFRDSDLKISTEVEQNAGKHYPIIIGQPGAGIMNLDSSGEIQTMNANASPAYLVTPTPFPANIYLVIAGHPVEADEVNIRDNTGSLAGPLTVEEIYIISLQRTISRVDIGGTSITASISSDAQYFVQWEYGGGLSNPYGTGALTGGADICRYVLESLNIDIDWAAWEGAAPLLNSYTFDGYINEPINSIEFLESEIIPYLPCELFFGPRGMKPIISHLYMNRFQTPVKTIIENSSFSIISALTSELQPGDIVNSVFLEYAYQISSDSFTASVDLNPMGEYDNPFTFTNGYAELSLNRFGLKRAVLSTTFIKDFNVAIRVVEDYLRLRCLGALTVNVRTDITWGYLEIGDIISLTSENIYVQNLLCMVVRKTFQDNSFLYTLRFEDNPLQNKRSYD
jgi:hypothetical protein